VRDPTCIINIRLPLVHMRVPKDLGMTTMILFVEP